MLADTWTKDVKFSTTPPNFRELRILLKASVIFAYLAHRFYRESPIPIPCTLGITAPTPPTP